MPSNKKKVHDIPYARPEAAKLYSPISTPNILEMRLLEQFPAGWPDGFGGTGPFTVASLAKYNVSFQVLSKEKITTCLGLGERPRWRIEDLFLGPVEWKKKVALPPSGFMNTGAFSQLLDAVCPTLRVEVAAKKNLKLTWPMTYDNGLPIPDLTRTGMLRGSAPRAPNVYVPVSDRQAMQQACVARAQARGEGALAALADGMLAGGSSLHLNQGSAHFARHDPRTSLADKPDTAAKIAKLARALETGKLSTTAQRLDPPKNNEPDAQPRNALRPETARHLQLARKLAKVAVPDLGEEDETFMPSSPPCDLTTLPAFAEWDEDVVDMTRPSLEQTEQILHRFRSSEVPCQVEVLEAELEAKQAEAEAKQAIADAKAAKVRLLHAQHARPRPSASTSAAHHASASDVHQVHVVDGERAPKKSKSADTAGGVLSQNTLNRIRDIRAKRFTQSHESS